MLNGRTTVHRYESKVLRSNPLTDPHIRDLIIYLPPEYTESSSHGYIAVFGLVGFGGQGKMLLNADPLGENIEDRMNRLISEKKCGPMVLVLLDCLCRHVFLISDINQFRSPSLELALNHTLGKSTSPT
jgi:hypothetical protein